MVTSIPCFPLRTVPHTHTSHALSVCRWCPSALHVMTLYFPTHPRHKCVRAPFYREEESGVREVKPLAFSFSAGMERSCHPPNPGLDDPRPHASNHSPSQRSRSHVG